MPTLHNPTDVDLTCYLLGRLVKADETVEITDEQADALEGGPVFVVERDTKRPSPAEEVAAKPKRERVKRGSKRAEVTKAPEPETRG